MVHIYVGTTARRVWGRPIRKFLEFRGYEVASETISGPKTMLLGGQPTEFYMHIAQIAWKTQSSHCSQPSCIMSPHCVGAMGVCRALALFGDTKQAMGDGKSGPTGLTGPVATALYSNQA